MDFRWPTILGSEIYSTSNDVWCQKSEIACFGTNNIKFMKGRKIYHQSASEVRDFPFLLNFHLRKSTGLLLFVNVEKPSAVFDQQLAGSAYTLTPYKKPEDQWLGAHKRGQGVNMQRLNLQAISFTRCMCLPLVTVPLNRST